MQLQKMNPRLGRKFAAALAFAATMAFAAFADYTFFVEFPSGYATYGEYASGVSAAASSSSNCENENELATGALSRPATLSASLEARYRTWQESAGTGLRSTKGGVLVIFM